MRASDTGERADALQASGELAPMIMVFPMTRYDDAKTIEADMADGVRGPSQMERFLCEELIPYIDAHYSTIPSAEGRAIGGFLLDKIISSRNRYISVPRKFFTSKPLTSIFLTRRLL